MNSQIKEMLLDARYLIEKALTDFDFLAAVVNDSTRHDNGFDKIVLRGRGEKIMGCRVHAWKPDSQDSNIHSHRWDMLSYILDGSYEASEYSLSHNKDVGEIFYKYKFSPTLENQYSLTLQGQEQLLKAPSKILSPNDFYVMKIGELHKVEKVSSEGALTLVFSWGTDAKTANVYSQNIISEFHSNQKALQQTHVLNLLSKVKDRLDHVTLFYDS